MRRMVFDPAQILQSAPQAAKMLMAEAARRSLKEFTKQAWPILEPGRAFVDGWYIGAMCEHLQAAASGEIKRLVVTVPPGSMKSRLCRVKYPLWLWTRNPHLKFLGASYALSLSERDNYYARLILQSQWYQDSFGVKISADQGAKVNFDNEHMGGMRAISVGGATTGFRGDYNICFPAGEMVATESGPLPIDEVVKRADPNLRVWTLDPTRGRMVLDAPTRWLKNPASDIVEVGFSDGSKMRCTPDHLVLVNGKWKRADALTPSDTLPAFVVSGGAQTLGDIAPHLASSDSADMHDADTEFFGQNPSRAFAVRDDIARHFGGHFDTITRTKSAVRFGISDVLRARSICEVINTVVEGIAVNVSSIVPFGTWADKSGSYALVNPHNFGAATNARVKPRVPSGSGRGFEDLLRGVVLKLLTAARTRYDVAILRSHQSSVGDGVSLVSSGYKTPLYVRRVGHADSTFCLTMRTGNFVCAETIVSNCDDAHNASEGESDAKRSEAVQWFLETFQTRVNDLNTSPIIVIGQRIHEEDVPGVAIEMGYEHLNIPMEWDETYRKTTVTGWTDPRTKEGELMAPDRFSAEAVERLKKALGPYAAAAQLQQHPVPRKGGLFHVDAIEPIDSLPDEPFIAVRAWDIAGTKGGGAYTAGVKMLYGRKSDIFYIADVRRKQVSHAGVKEMIEQAAEDDGIETMIILPQDPGAAGKAVADDLVAMLKGYNVKVEAQSGDKETRAKPLSSQVERAHVKILKRVWTKAFIDEARFFPKGRYKDQADAASSAFNALAPLARKKKKAMSLVLGGEKQTSIARVG